MFVEVLLSRKREHQHSMSCKETLCHLPPSLPKPYFCPSKTKILKQERLYFIDALRAFAIIMMMQGHFVDTLLDPEYRESGTIYDVWNFLRGMTAPVFFTISGFVFIYLLLKTSDSTQSWIRIKKGIKRGLLLIFLGYLLRVPLLGWLFGDFNNYFLIVDVLQCIGLGLLFLIVLFYLSLKNKWVLMLFSLLICLAVFMAEPTYRDATFDFLPLVLSNYFTDVHGSVFTIIPWFGFICFGVFMATGFNLFEKLRQFKTVAIVSIVLTAVFLSEYSSYTLNELFLSTELLLFKQVAYYNYLFIRLGHVLFLFAFFYALNNYFKSQWITQIGQKTLSIYVVHFIILYGSFTGLGLRQLTGATLSPWGAAVGASLFVIGVSILSVMDFYSNTFFYDRWKILLDRMRTKSK
jgi:uncharacterized membrane protein